MSRYPTSLLSLSLCLCCKLPSSIIDIVIDEARSNWKWNLQADIGNLFWAPLLGLKPPCMKKAKFIEIHKPFSPSPTQGNKIGIAFHSLDVFLIYHFEATVDIQYWPLGDFA